MQKTANHAIFRPYQRKIEYLVNIQMTATVVISRLSFYVRIVLSQGCI